jgi:drug/metabolite transporter (DMT)-like permease
MRIADLIKLLLLGAIWGSSYLFMKLALPLTGAFFTSAARIVIGTVFILLLAFVKKQLPDLISHYKAFLLAGLLNLIVPYVSITYASRYVNASTGATLNATTPIFTLLLAAVFLKEEITVRKIAGICLGIIGVVVLVGWNSHPQPAGSFKGIALCLLAAVAYASANIYTRINFKNLGALQIVTGQMLFSSLVLLPVALPLSVNIHLTVNTVAIILCLALLSTVAGYLLYFQLVQSAGPVKASLVTFIIPVFSFCWSSLFLNEPVTGNALVSFLLIVSGLVCILYPLNGNKQQ